jgi:hypothetical protein
MTTLIHDEGKDNEYNIGTINHNGKNPLVTKMKGERASVSVGRINDTSNNSKQKWWEKSWVQAIFFLSAIASIFALFI